MIREFLTYLRSIRGYSENTVRAYGKDLAEFAQWVKESTDHAKWSALTRDDIDKFLIHQAERGLKPSTTNRQLSAISSLYVYFMREGLMDHNPCKYESRRKQPQTMPNTISVEAIRKAYNKAQGMTKTMLGLLATTGIRLQEMLDLRWQDIDFENAQLRIMGKGSKERIVQTDASVLASLAQVRQYARPEMRLFYVGQRHTRYLIYEALRPYSNSRQLSPHAIRHTFATELAKNGETTTTIAKILGHSHLETSQKYINMAEIAAPRHSITLNQ